MNSRLSRLRKWRPFGRDQQERMCARVLTKPLKRVARISTHIEERHIEERHVEKVSIPPATPPHPPCFVVRNARIRAHVAFRLRLPLSPIRTIPAIDRCNRLLSCVTEEDLCASLVTEQVSIRLEEGKKALSFFEKIFLSNDSFGWNIFIFVFYERCFLIFFFFFWLTVLWLTSLELFASWNFISKKYVARIYAYKRNWCKLIFEKGSRNHSSWRMIYNWINLSPWFITFF